MANARTCDARATLITIVYYIPYRDLSRILTSVKILHSYPHADAHIFPADANVH